MSPRATRLALVAAAVSLGGIALAWAAWPSPPPPRPSRPPEAYAPIAKIDVHVHVPAPRYEEAAAAFARHGVRLALNASGGHPGEGLDGTIAASARVDGAIRSYCNLDWSRAEQGFADYATRTLERCAERGAVGLKIFKGLGLGTRLSDGSRLRVDDPRLDPAFEAAGRLGLPVLIHTGDPQAFFRPPTEENERYAELEAHPSWSFYGPEWPSWEEIFAEYEARVARHPGTRFLGAHFGNAPEEPERVARMLERYPNLYVETGARVPELGRHDAARMRALFVRHRERILFGTDIQLGRSAWILGSSGAEPDSPARVPFFYEAHWRYFETADRDFAHPTPIQGDWTIDGLDLPVEVLHDLYHRNAERLFGLPEEGA